MARPLLAVAHVITPEVAARKPSFSLVLAVAMSACGSHGGSPSAAPDASTQSNPDGGCLLATDCPAGSYCNCGYLNIDSVTSGCELPGSCIIAPPPCDAGPVDILCDEGGSCPFGATCGGFGFCTAQPCSIPDVSSDSGADAAVEDSGAFQAPTADSGAADSG